MNTTELKALAEKATPGPWTLEQEMNTYIIRGAEQKHTSPEGFEHGFCDYVASTWGEVTPINKARGEWIAAANPAAILALIAALESAQEERRALLATVQNLREELAECKAAYESQFKELHALKASIGEPVAWLVLSTNPDGSTSIEYAAEWKDAAHDHISDAIMEYGNTEAGSWIVRPAYAIKDKQP